jgi:hypothetical protein
VGWGSKSQPGRRSGLGCRSQVPVHRWNPSSSTFHTRTIPDLISIENKAHSYLAVTHTAALASLGPRAGGRLGTRRARSQAGLPSTHFFALHVHCPLAPSDLRATSNLPQTAGGFLRLSAQSFAHPEASATNVRPLARELER